MKKAALIMIVVFGMVALTSCTDTANDLQERIEIENEQLIDNGEIGDDQEEEQQVEGAEEQGN